MSLEFLRKKRFQRRHPDVFCQRVSLTIPCVSSLSVTPHQVLQSFHCSLQLDQLWHVQERGFLRATLMLFQSSRGPNVYVDAARVPDLLQIQSPRRCRAILLPRGSSALCTVGLPAFAECPEASQLPLPHSLLSLLPILFPRPTSRRLSLQGVCSRRSSLCVVPKTRTHSLCSSTVEAVPNLSYPPRLDWLVLDLLRLTLPLPLSAQGTVANLTRLGRDLVADFAVVALAAMLDASVDSESSSQPAVQRVVLDPFSRGPAVTFLTQASDHFRE